MKGLLLKDLYMASKYCRAFALLIIVFLAVSFFGDESIFFIVYPTMVAGMIPMTLLSYDEKNKWSQYSETLPCSRAQFVSVKYIVGLIFSGFAWLISLISIVLRMSTGSSFSFDGLLFWGTALLVLGVLGPMLMLPFVFKFGTEKGRIGFYVMIGLLCAISVLANGLGLQTSVISGNQWILGMIVVVAVLLYLLSWRLSILFYQKREL